MPSLQRSISVGYHNIHHGWLFLAYACFPSVIVKSAPILTPNLNDRSDYYPTLKRCSLAILDLEKRGDTKKERYSNMKKRKVEI